MTTSLARITVAPLALLALILALFVATPPSKAEAAVTYPHGFTGSISVGPAYINRGPFSVTGPKNVSGPEILVGRNGRVSNTLAQRVAVTYTVQQWVNGAWITNSTDVKAMSGWMYAGQTQIRFNPAIINNFGGGLYRVAATVGWYDYNQKLEDYSYVYPTTVGDSICNVANCVAKAGYFQLL